MFKWRKMPIMKKGGDEMAKFDLQAWVKEVAVETVLLSALLVALATVLPMLPVIGVLVVPAFEITNPFLWLGMLSAVAIKNLLWTNIVLPNLK